MLRSSVERFIELYDTDEGREIEKLLLDHHNLIREYIKLCNENNKKMPIRQELIEHLKQVEEEMQCEKQMIESIRVKAKEKCDLLKKLDIEVEYENYFNKTEGWFDEE